MLVSCECMTKLTISTTRYLSSQVDKLTPTNNRALDNILITMNLVSSSLLARIGKISAQDLKLCSQEELFNK